MPVPLRITARNINVDQASERLVRRHAARLEQLHPRLHACRVTVEVPQRHRAGGPISYNVRLDLSVPRGDIVVTRQGRPTLPSAIQGAFGAARRRLHDESRRRGAGKRRAVTGRMS